MYIVSANYRDRNSRYRWLIRRENEELSKAVAYQSVTATGVKFRDSNKEEEGFGCKMVAFCETAEGENPEPQKVKLHFNGTSFVRAGTREVVEKCSSLTLGADGSVSAVVR